MLIPGRAAYCSTSKNWDTLIKTADERLALCLDEGRLKLRA